MNRTLATLLVAASTTLAVWLLSGRHWTDAVIGAVLSLSLWVMLFAGSFAGEPRGVVPARVYAMAAVLGTALGYVFFRTQDNGAWWATGFILAGAVLPSVSRMSGRTTGEQ